MTDDLHSDAGDVGGDLMGGPSRAGAHSLRRGGVDGGQESGCFELRSIAMRDSFLWTRCTDTRLMFWKLAGRIECREGGAASDLYDGADRSLI